MRDETTNRVEELLAADPIDADGLAAALDALTDAQRARVVAHISPAAQRRLWDATSARPTSLEDFVPPEVGRGREVVHAGRNSLPLLSRFEKRFCRVDGVEDRLFGYNESPARGVIGPGYFVARAFDERGLVGVDYHEVPPADAGLPATWPPVKPNEKGLQRFVYAKTIDYMRRVSTHVTIGRAYGRGGTEPTNNTFVLCRRVGDDEG